MGDPEAFVRRRCAAQLPFPVGVVCERNVHGARAFTMSVPAFIDISEEDQVCSRAADAARVGGGGRLRDVRGRVGFEPGPGARSVTPRSRAPESSAAVVSSAPGSGQAERQGRTFRVWSCISPPAGAPSAGPRLDGLLPGRRQDSSSLGSLLSVDTVLLTH